MGRLHHEPRPDLKMSSDPTAGAPPIADSDNSHLLALGAGWTSTEFAAFLEKATRLLAKYREADLAGAERELTAIDIERELWPLVFQTRVEPRRTVARAWRSLELQQPATFKEGLASLLRQAPSLLLLPELEMLLLLLAEAGIMVSDEVVFRVLRRLEVDRARESAQSVASRLAAVLSGDGLATMSLLERLKQSKMLSLPVFYGAARKVAAWDPSRLSLLLRLFGVELLKGENDVATLGFLVSDLVARAGPFTTLNAICDIDPRDSPVLFKAAFAGPEAPFTVRSIISGDRRARRTHILVGGEEIPIDLLDAPARDEEWELKFRSVTGVIPELEIRRQMDAPIGATPTPKAPSRKVRRPMQSLTYLVRDRLSVTVAGASS
jgi:hypothetical protein